MKNNVSESHSTLSDSYTVKTSNLDDNLYVQLIPRWMTQLNTSTSYIKSSFIARALRATQPTDNKTASTTGGPHENI